MRDAGYEVGITAEDADMLDAYDYVIGDESVIDVGRLRLHTIHTPGHTPGSMCFRIEGSPVLFSGDTLVPRRAGQHQLPQRRLRHDHRRRSTGGCSPRSIPTPSCCPATATRPRIGTERPHLQEWVDRGW